MLTTDPTLDHLYGLFPNSPDRPEAIEIAAVEVPQPYHRLLVHSHHMTVTVEEHYSSPVGVRVLDFWLSDQEYARKIVLALQSTGQIVQFGLVRINLGVCPAAVRKEILEGKTPLGRILITHNMLRRIEPVAFLRVKLADEMADWFAVKRRSTTYGRLGVIYTGEKPAIEVLEILAPIQPIGK